MTILPYRSRSKGFEENCWSGEIELVWKGSPIHFRRFWIPNDPMPSTAMTLIATKDRIALEDLFRQGMRWARERLPGLKTTIHVINGPNYKRPKIGWDKLILPEGMKRQIREGVEAFLAGRKQYRELGVAYRRGFLFIGPPGNGKTLVTKVIASEYRVSMVTLLLKSDLEERHVDQAFGAACQYAPCVLILEDLDKLASATRVSLSYILNRLDGMESPEGVLTIATTNDPAKLDPALLHRPSRFDRVWEFGLPAEEERLALLRLKGAKYFTEDGLARAAEASGGFSMAYVQEAVVSALMAAVHEKTGPQDRHLAEALQELKTQIKVATSGSKLIGGVPAVGFSHNGH